jgi:hypothetical protein
MGGSEDGDGKGTNAYGVTGMTDGLASVSTLILVVVEGAEGSRGEVLFPEYDKLVELDIDVTEGDKDCGERVDGRRDKGVGKCKGKEDEDKVENEGAAKARAAARSMSTADDHMGSGGTPCNS